jgi:hypothetical protein
VLADRLGLPTLSVVNTVGSLIARTTKLGVYLNAGRESSVASTKAFTTQVRSGHVSCMHMRTHACVSCTFVLFVACYTASRASIDQGQIQPHPYLSSHSSLRWPPLHLILSLVGDGADAHHGLVPPGK